MPRTPLSRWTIPLAALAVAAAALFVLAPAPSAEARQAPKTFTLEVPRRSYSAFVFSGVGIDKGQHATAVIRSNSPDNSGQFTVTVRGGQTVTVPFEGGWNVAALNRPVTIKISPAPDGTTLTAWGVRTKNGPIQFTAD